MNNQPRDYVVFFRLQRTAVGPTLADRIEPVETLAYSPSDAWFQAATVLDATFGGLSRVGLEGHLLTMGPNAPLTHLRARALATAAALAVVEPRSVA